MSNKWRVWFKGQHTTLDKDHVGLLSALRGALWFHAASVGEFEQARPLLEKIRLEQPNRKIVVTFFSPSGYEARKHYPQADGIFYLPFPSRRNARLFIETLQPKMAIFVKYEFWPAYLRELKKRAIPTYSISAIFRSSQRFFHWYGHGALRVLKCFTHIYVQDEASHQLLLSHGVTQSSVAGDTRFDRVHDVLVGLQSAPHLAQALTPVAEFTEGCEHVLVAGSTWPKDEVLLARYMQCEERTAKLILVPHELDERHIQYIFNLFQGRIARYSAVSNPTLPSESRKNILQHASILLVDTMGLLSSVYRFGQVAYIGGGFGVGIHNTIEAAVYGVPVLFGPNYLHFREAQGLIEAGAARSVSHYDELETALQTAWEQHAVIGAKAAQYVNSELGATQKIYRDLFK